MSTWPEVELSTSTSLTVTDGHLRLPQTPLRSVVPLPLLSQTMGFFKRLLSAGSRKNKNKSSAKEETKDLRRYHSQTLPVLFEAESEATANRLLRTASSRLGTVHCSSGDEPLPPLPNRERILSLPCFGFFFFLLRHPLFKAHPEVDDEVETRSLPFLPNRR